MHEVVLMWAVRPAVKRLHKDLARYYTEALGHRLPSSPPNLTSIAKDGNTEETIKVASCKGSVWQGLTKVSGV